MGIGVVHGSMGIGLVCGYQSGCAMGISMVVVLRCMYYGSWVSTCQHGSICLISVNFCCGLISNLV